MLRLKIIHVRLSKPTCGDEIFFAITKAVKTHNGFRENGFADAIVGEYRTKVVKSRLLKEIGMLIQFYNKIEKKYFGFTRTTFYKSNGQYIYLCPIDSNHTYEEIKFSIPWDIIKGYPLNEFNVFYFHWDFESIVEELLKVLACLSLNELTTKGDKK